MKSVFILPTRNIPVHCQFVIKHRLPDMMFMAGSAVFSQIPAIAPEDFTKEAAGLSSAAQQIIDLLSSK